MRLQSQREIGGGIFIPTLSTDEYFAELALWFGVQSTDLPYILPNIANFHDLKNQYQPIGFLKKQGKVNNL